MDYLIAILFFLIFEYFADFICQSRDMAINKSKDLAVLENHLTLIIGSLSIGMALAFFKIWGGPVGLFGGIFFAAIYAVIHGFQDLFIWRLYKYIRRNESEDFKYWEDKLFYDFIGLDRLLHVSTGIILVFWFLR